MDVDKQNYYLSNLAQYTDPAAVEYSFVTLAAPDCDLVRDFQSKGWKAIGLDLLGRRKFPQAYRSLRKLIGEIQPHIIHTHTFDPSLLGLTAGKRAGLKTVLTRHHSDAIHQLESSVKRRFYLALEDYISRSADRIIAPSQIVREFLVEKEGVPKEKVSIIPYGQTTARYDAVTGEGVKAIREELKMADGIALVFVSRLFHRKGHKYLFEALSVLLNDGVNANLYLVGDGEYRSELEKMCRQLGIESRVRFLGWRDDALTIVAAGDVVVHPSLEDALSSAVIEAVMLEKPIVATDISGVRDSLGDSEHGEVVGPASSQEILKGIRKVLSNIEEAKEKATLGKKYLLEYMDARRVADDHAKLYAELIGANR
jgi:glycosyltransferase involved in cell wall biosynthesis